jgi:hypothetical protein
MPTRSRLSTTTEPVLEGAELNDGVRMPPLHPGEMLREEFMKPLPRPEQRLLRNARRQEDGHAG